MTALSSISFDYMMKIVCIQTTTIFYIYFYIWKLDLRLNNNNYHHSLSLLLLLNFWITSKPLIVCLKFKYYKSYSENQLKLPPTSSISDNISPIF